MKLKLIPNLLTFLRIAIIPFFIYFFVKGKAYICAILFLISGISDAADGFLARRFHWESNFGKILDPIADKLSYATVFFCLFAEGRIPLFFVIGFVLLQLLHALGATVVYHTKSTVVKSNLAGKLAGLSMFLFSFLNLVFYDKMQENNLVINYVSAAVLVLIAGATLAYYIEYFAIPAKNAKKTAIINPTEETK